MERKSDRRTARADESTLRRALERHLGPVSAEEWRFLQGEDIVATALDEERRQPGAGIKYAIHELERFRRYSSLARLQHAAQPEPRQRRYKASVRLIEALRRLQARAASRLPEVQAWRAQWLPDGLLAPEQVESFLRQPQQRALRWVLRSRPGDKPPTPESRPPADAEVVEVSSEWEPQASLHRLAERVAARLGWAEWAAAHWVLTGDLPQQGAIIVRRESVLPGALDKRRAADSPMPPAMFTVLVVPRFATPQMVADLLRSLRSVRGSRTRALSPQTAALLEHVAEHGDGRESWKLWRRKRHSPRLFKHWRQAVRRAWGVLERHAAI